MGIVSAIGKVTKAFAKFLPGPLKTMLGSLLGPIAAAFGIPLSVLGFSADKAADESESTGEDQEKSKEDDIESDKSSKKSDKEIDETQSAKDTKENTETIDFENPGLIKSQRSAKKTYEDFKKLNPNTDLFEVSKNNLGEYLEKNNFKNLDYLHITSNETIEGIQIKDFNEVAHSNLLVDMSSDLGSYPFSFDKVSYIYAGAQKNMGIPGVTICLVNKDFLIDVDNSNYLNLKKLTTSNSVLNTPPTFSIFVLNLVTEWMIKSGGLDYFEKKSISQSNELYKFLDENSNLFDFSSELRFRSKSNVVFKFKEDKYNDTFIKQANDSGIIGINGHRSIGGIRVSLFNSVDQPMFNYFMDFFKKFINESL